jgi:hypothetical protein
MIIGMKRRFLSEEDQESVMSQSGRFGGSEVVSIGQGPGVLGQSRA